MKLKGINGVAVTAELEPADCAHLVRICKAGEEHLRDERDEGPTVLLARTYGAAFASFAVSIQGWGYMQSKDKAWLYDDLIEQELSHLVTEPINERELDKVKAEKARIDARFAA